jgi:hypothetical protein
MNMKVTALALLVILMVPMIFFLNTNTDQHRVPAFTTLSRAVQENANTTSHLIIDQKDLQLDHEVIQYKIIFHKNDIINVSTRLLIQQSGNDVEPKSCLLICTNGTSSIFEKSNVSFLFYVPSALLLDVTMFRHRIAIGGSIFFRILNHTRFRIGIARELSNDVTVKNGDVWYLTLADTDKSPGEQLIFTCISLSSSASMEIIQLERHSDIGFYSALDNDFEGHYLGFKLPFLPFGVSIASNLHKEVNTLRGSVVYFCSVGHLRGRIRIEAPNNRTYLNANNGMALFTYCGNWTGTWNFSSSGVGFPWKHNVMLFYADVDPHIKLMER